MYQNKAKNTVFWRENLIKELQERIQERLDEIKTMRYISFLCD